LIRVIWTT